MNLLNNPQKLLFLLYNEENHQLSMMEAQDQLHRSIQQLSRLSKKLINKGLITKRKTNSYSMLKLTRKGKDEVEEIVKFLRKKSSPVEIPMQELETQFKSTLKVLEDYFPKQQIRKLLDSLIDDVELTIC